MELRKANFLLGNIESVLHDQGSKVEVSPYRIERLDPIHVDNLAERRCLNLAFQYYLNDIARREYQREEAVDELAISWNHGPLLISPKMKLNSIPAEDYEYSSQAI